MPASSPYVELPLPSGIRSSTISEMNGMSVHFLEAGFETPGRPILLLLHGFPELAYSWRKVMLPLASAGYHVVAPDQRGFGRTTGWDATYDADLSRFSMLNMVRDAIGTIFALGQNSVAAVIGHDAGSPVAAWCALLRPDVFTRVAMMSAPFSGPPALPFNTANNIAETEPMSDRRNLSGDDMDLELASLERPRKYYQRYYTTRKANQDMLLAPQGLRSFIRAYYHVKSADWSGNRPFRLGSASAEELAIMPTYYVMDREQDMAETVAREMPSAEVSAACKWLTEDELGVYVAEYGRTGFQGGLQGYRRSLDPGNIAELQIFADRTINVPSCFIAGKSDWGVYQTPGAVEAMQNGACTRMLGVHLVEGAGHWVQQERPDEVSKLLLDFLAK